MKGKDILSYFVYVSCLRKMNKEIFGRILSLTLPHELSQKKIYRLFRSVSIFLNMNVTLSVQVASFCLNRK